MKIEILGAESLGVRGLSCLVRTRDRRILIDPGVALGYHRQGLLPHPVQVAAGEDIRQTIVDRLQIATDVVISHFHGDHMPLPDANPYQLALESVRNLLEKPHVWVKSERGETRHVAERRRLLLAALKRTPQPCDGQTYDPLAFSDPMPHGPGHNPMGTVMMTRVREGNEVFVHASDIQLLADEPIARILEWSPTTLLASGPALYRNVPADERARARDRALKLARDIPVCVIDHHLLRSPEGMQWLDERRAETGGRIMCAADYMKKERRCLESERAELYERIPVPREWHKSYARGKATTLAFRGGTDS